MFATLPRAFVVVAVAFMAVCNSAAVIDEQALAKRDNVQLARTKLDCTSDNTHCIYISGNGYLSGAEKNAYTPCEEVRGSKGASELLLVVCNYKSCQYPVQTKAFVYCVGTNKATIEVDFSSDFSYFKESGYVQALWSSDKNTGNPQYITSTQKKGDDLFVTCSA